MSAFTRAELEYFGSQRPGRLATTVKRRALRPAARGLIKLATFVIVAGCSSLPTPSASSVPSSPVVGPSLAAASVEPASPSPVAGPTIACRTTETRCGEALALAQSGDLAPIAPDKVVVIVDLCNPEATCPPDFDVLVAVIDRSFRLGDSVQAVRVRGGAHAQRVEPWPNPSLPEWILPVVRAAADLP
jgi:hypothetical protein